jgi:hypothetical protein
VVTKRKSVSMLLGMALLAGMLFVGTALPSNANTGQVECMGDDDVLQGSLNDADPPGSDPDMSQRIVDLLHSLADPPVAAGQPFESEVAARVDPSAVPPGVSDLDFYMEIILSADLIDTASEYGITTIDMTNLEFELAPGAGIDGPNLVANPDPITVDLSGPIDAEAGPFTETYDITAAIGDQVEWDLVGAQVGISIDIPDLDASVTMGLSCEKVSADPLISAFVLDNDPGAPGVPAREVETDEDTPVDIDLLDGVTEGDAATDPDSVSIVGDPANGTVTLDGSTATYTPDTGYVGEDQFAYEVCTEPFVTVAAVNEIDNVVLTLDQVPTGPARGAEFGTYTLTVDGQTTGPIPATATISEIETAVEALSTVGAGNATVVGGFDDYTIEFNGALAGTPVDVSIDDSLLFGTGSVTETQAAVAAVTGVACGSNVVTVTVLGEDEPATPTTPPPATPQPVAAAYTG